jgi:hypothetical protein
VHTQVQDQVSIVDREMHMKQKSKNNRTEVFDKEMRKDLDRSENEGYSVIYKSEKDKQSDDIKQEIKKMAAPPAQRRAQQTNIRKAQAARRK